MRYEVKYQGRQQLFHVDLLHIGKNLSQHNYLLCRSGPKGRIKQELYVTCVRPGVGGRGSMPFHSQLWMRRA